VIWSDRSPFLVPCDSWLSFWELLSLQPWKILHIPSYRTLSRGWHSQRCPSTVPPTWALQCLQRVTTSGYMTGNCKSVQVTNMVRKSWPNLAFYFSSREVTKIRYWHILQLISFYMVLLSFLRHNRAESHSRSVFDGNPTALWVSTRDAPRSIVSQRFQQCPSSAESQPVTLVVIAKANPKGLEM